MLFQLKHNICDLQNKIMKKQESQKTDNNFVGSDISYNSQRQNVIQITSPNQRKNKKYSNKSRKCSESQLFLILIITLIFIILVGLCFSLYFQNQFYKQDNDLMRVKLTGKITKPATSQINSKGQISKQHFQQSCYYFIQEQKKVCQKKVAQTKRQYQKTINDINKYVIIRPKVPPIPPVKKPAYFPNKEQLQILDAKKDLIVVTHAGRQKYMEILYKHLSKQKLHFFEWHLWVRTQDSSDKLYLQKLQKQNKWIKRVFLNPPVNYNFAMIHFYKQDCQKNKIYLKLDDDIIWMQDEFVKKMFQARLKLAQYFIVFPNIINSVIHFNIQQRMNVFQYPKIVEYNCNGNGWIDPQIGAQLHIQFLESLEEGNVQKWKCFKQWIAFQDQRISINAMIYYSETIRSVQFFEHIDDEIFYTGVYPRMYGKHIIILGEPICSHAAYMTQREYFNTNYPQFYSQYKSFADKL